MTASTSVLGTDLRISVASTDSPHARWDYGADGQVRSSATSGRAADFARPLSVSEGLR